VVQAVAAAAVQVQAQAQEEGSVGSTTLEGPNVEVVDEIT
jgi:flagellar basal body rod protein FlgG